jgi:twin arginine-targeting protein translocase, TatA/E family
MGAFSTWHWIIILIIVLMLFGNRLPSVMRSLGQGVTEFKKGINSTDSDDDEDEEEEVTPKKKKKKTAEASSDEGE